MNGTRGAVLALAASVALVGFSPSAVAVCGGSGGQLTWPSDGVTDVPLDAVVFVYRDLNYPAGSEKPLSITLVDPSGNNVAGSASEQLLGGYTLLTFTPEDHLLPMAEYEWTVTVGMSTEPKRGFTTSDSAAGLGALPVPQLEYHGLGVFPKGQMVSVATSNATLVLTLCGAGLDSRIILLEVLSEAGESVFLVPLLADHYVDDQAWLGASACYPHFPVDANEHYCVQAAVLDHTGKPGVFSLPSCSEAVGVWGGDYVAFDPPIPESSCNGEVVTAIPESDDKRSNPDSDEATDGNGGRSSAGCSTGPGPPGPWLPVLTLLALAVVVARLRRQPGPRRPCFEWATRGPKKTSPP